MKPNTDSGTLRDVVWSEVLKLIRQKGWFKISELPFNESQRYTARRVLRTMEDMNWLKRTNDRAAIWFAGESALLHLNLHQDKIQAINAKFTSQSEK